MRGSGCPADAQRTAPRGSTVTYAIVMNLPTAISPTTTSFACARNSDGSECSRASDRNTNFAIAMSAVASMPCPVTSPRTTARRPSASSMKSKTSPPTSTCAADSYTAPTSIPSISGCSRGSSERCIVSANSFCCW